MQLLHYRSISDSQLFYNFRLFFNWVSVKSGSWWWTGRPGVLRFMGSQRVGHNWVTDLIWSDNIILLSYVEHNDSIFVKIVLHLKLLQSNGCIYLCCTMYPCGLSMLYIVVCILPLSLPFMLLKQHKPSTLLH